MLQGGLKLPGIALVLDLEIQLEYKMRNGAPSSNPAAPDELPIGGSCRVDSAMKPHTHPGRPKTAPVARPGRPPPTKQSINRGRGTAAAPGQ